MIVTALWTSVRIRDEARRVDAAVNAVRFEETQFGQRLDKEQGCADQLVKDAQTAWQHLQSNSQLPETFLAQVSALWMEATLCEQLYSTK